MKQSAFIFPWDISVFHFLKEYHKTEKVETEVICLNFFGRFYFWIIAKMKMENVQLSSDNTFSVDNKARKIVKMNVYTINYICIIL